MQTLKEKLKEDLKVALKTGDVTKKVLIQVILGEVALEETRGRSDFRMNDDGVISLIKKIKKNQEDTKVGYEEQHRDVPESIIKEIEILNSYLPKQMSYADVEAQVDIIINEIGATSMKDMGQIMKILNDKHKGEFDGKIVAEIVKKQLNKQ